MGGPLAKQWKGLKPDDGRRCLACAGPGVLVKYEHDGKVDDFHPTCVGAWLMLNPDSVIFFAVGVGHP
jgi:hypothetical protein